METSFDNIDMHFILAGLNRTMQYGNKNIEASVGVVPTV